MFNNKKREIRYETKSITGRRIHQKLLKKEKTDKRIKRTTLLFVLLSLCFLGGITFFIVKQYQTTKHWTSTELSQHYNQLPPELVKNHISNDLLADVNTLGKLNQTIDQLSTKEKLNQNDVKKLKKDLKKGQELLKKHQLKAGQYVSKITFGQWMIDTTTFLQSAYNEPDTAKLATLLKETSKSSYALTTIKTLQKVNDDYTALNTFLEESLPTFVTENKQVLTLRVLNADETKQILEKSKNLTAFPALEKLRKNLQSTNWKKAQERKGSFEKEAAWKAFQSQFAQLYQHDYVQVSSIKTLEDAKVYGNAAIENATDKDGYVLSNQSSVSQIALEDGTLLKNSQYIRKGTPILVTIKADYKEVPKPSSSSSSSQYSSSTSSSSDTKTSSDTGASSSTSSTSSSLNN